MRDGFGDVTSLTRTKIIDFIRSYSTGTTLASNIAYHNSVTVSSNENSVNTSDKVVDTNGNTRWSSAYSQPQWIYVDLGTTYNYSNRMGIIAYARNDYLESSNDAKTKT
ncbi:unnamed protein product [Adineta ricciae]|uniref:F5/8 type C domain-containing protein n=1 Tax=Adineta ricciae TaxID=249248 RepID=A0A814VML1_ADIRI|nr:unnamed protein product [Adineta ricciae]CAF1461538.1 unnamed protein product [Adineta ricciae]